MKRFILFSPFLGITLILACTSPNSESIRWSPTIDKIASPGLIPLFDAVRLADGEAAKELKRVNEENRSWVESDGPFALNDFDKAIHQGYKGTRPFVSIAYDYRNPVTFRGHPAHFDVWVFRDNGEIRFFGGR